MNKEKAVTKLFELHVKAVVDAWVHKTMNELRQNKKLTEENILSGLDEWRSTPEYQEMIEETVFLFSQVSGFSEEKIRLLNRNAKKKKPHLVLVE